MPTKRRAATCTPLCKASEDPALPVFWVWSPASGQEGCQGLLFGLLRCAEPEVRPVTDTPPTSSPQVREHCGDDCLGPHGRKRGWGQEGGPTHL